MRAASRGIINFREARLHDPDWWRHCQLLIRGMVWEDDLKLQRSVFDFHLALVSNSGLTEESFKQSQKHAKDAFYNILGLLRPWEGTTPEARQKQEIDALKQAYHEAFGESLDNPEFIQREKEAVARWAAEREAQRSDFEDDMDRVMRLRRESQQKIAALRKQGR